MDSEIGKILRDFKPEYAERLMQLRAAESKYIQLKKEFENDQEFVYPDGSLGNLDVDRLKPEIKEEHFELKSLISDKSRRLRSSGNYKLPSNSKDEILDKKDDILEDLKDSKDSIRNRKILTAILLLLALGIAYIVFVEIIPGVFL